MTHFAAFVLGLVIGLSAASSPGNPNKPKTCKAGDSFWSSRVYSCTVEEFNAQQVQK